MVWRPGSKMEPGRQPPVISEKFEVPDLEATNIAFNLLINR